MQLSGDTLLFMSSTLIKVMLFICWLCYLFVCFKNKWSSKRNSLPIHLGMVICTHYFARVYSKLTQGHFLLTFTSFRKCHFKDHVCLDKSWQYSICLYPFVSCKKGLTDIQSQTDWVTLSHTDSQFLYTKLHLRFQGYKSILNCKTKPNKTMCK